jgi:RimJ/RimL family protein N-acetyltransferase
MSATANFWQGRLVRLRAVEPSDAEVHYRWNQDAETFRRLDRIHFPQSLAATRRWADEASLGKPEGDNFHFQVESLAGELVGSVAAHHCDPRNGTFQVAVATAPEQRRKGYAAEAVVLLLRYYFLELRYQKTTVYLLAFNEPSQRLVERLGFQPEGRLRRMHFTDGQYVDELVYGMTSEEFATLHAEALQRGSA